MDTTDPEIVFDDRGICNHCHAYQATITSPQYLRRVGPGALASLLAEIKAAGRGKRYDCIIGVSGGVDSTFVAYKTRELGLRPLAVHLDNGWNSELAVKNVEAVLSRLQIDLHTDVLDWSEFKALQVAFLRSSTPHLEIPTDHAILAALYAAAAREGVRYILSGHNTATESGGVRAWVQGHADWRYVQQIHKRFGDSSLRSYPHVGIFNFLYYSLVRRVQWVQFLDFVGYDKEKAVEVLETKLGWRSYGEKHHESIITRFYLGYFLPEKFGFDFRLVHLSSMIRSGQLSRDEALQEMEVVTYAPDQQRRDRDYVIKKLGLSAEQFDELMQRPPKTFEDYPSYKRWFSPIRPLMAVYHRLKRR